MDALLKVLASESPCSVPMLVHTAWLLRKLLVFLNMKLEGHELELFKVRNLPSYMFLFCITTNSLRGEQNVHVNCVVHSPHYRMEQHKLCCEEMC